MDHGKIQESLLLGSREAESVIANLKNSGIDIDNICVRLLEEGVIMFKKSFDDLVHTIELKIKNKKCK